MWLVSIGVPSSGAQFFCKNAGIPLKQEDTLVSKFSVEFGKKNFANNSTFTKLSSVIQQGKK